MKGATGFNKLRENAAILGVFGFKSLDLGKPHHLTMQTEQFHSKNLDVEL